MELPHHNLVAWQRADDLFITVHLLSRAFPPYERYELGSQMRRAAGIAGQEGGGTLRGLIDSFDIKR
jgi:hypothetical protein